MSFAEPYILVKTQTLAHLNSYSQHTHTHTHTHTQVKFKRSPNSISLTTLKFLILDEVLLIQVRN